MLFIQAVGPEKAQPTAALNPRAAFVFGSNSCGMNGWRTLIRAKKWEKQMSSFGALPVPFSGRYIPRRVGQRN